MKLRIVFSIVLFNCFANAQTVEVPLNYISSKPFESDLYSKPESEHTILRPFTFSSQNIHPADTTSNLPAEKRSWIRRKLLDEHFIQYDTTGLYLTVDPLIDGRFWQDLSTSDRYYLNSRGITVGGFVGKRFAFETSFRENQIIAPGKINSLIKSYDVFPGMGRVKPFKKDGYDFAMASGSFYSYFGSNIYLKAGHGKFFVGDGYRSFLLSDNAFNYPFASLNFKNKKWFYSYTIASFSILNEPKLEKSRFSEGYFRKKTYTMNVVNFNASKNFSVGLFESTVWDMFTNDHPHFNYAVVNPVIFGSTIMNGLSARNNTMVGLNGKLTFLGKYILYSQVAVDEIGNEQKNKIGVQAGAKAYDVAGVKNLFLQAELNKSSRYLYTHERSSQSFTHMNQPIAHSAGAGFTEAVGIVYYRYKKVFATAKMVYSKYHSSLTGTDVLIDEKLITSYMIIPGENLNMQFIAGYEFNRSNFLQLFGGIEMYKTNLRNDENLVVFGLRTALDNLYADF